MKRPSPKREIRPPTVDDAWATATREKCARAIAGWLKQTANTQRPINTLKLDELMCMAEAATACFIVEASRRVADPVTPEEEKKALLALLV